MSDDCSELSQIEITLEQSNINNHERLYINVKGKSLEECRKHFEEIKNEAEVKK